MNIVIFGASGFVGSALVESLISQKHKLQLIVRSKEKLPNFFYYKNVDLYEFNIVNQVKGGKLDKELGTIISRAEVIINLIGVIEDTKDGESNLFELLHVKFVELLSKSISNEQRYIHISANGVDMGVKTKYFITKLKGETIIQSKIDNYVILRPSLIWDKKRVQGFRSKIELSLSFPFLGFVLGKGKFKINIIQIEEVIEEIKKSIHEENRKRKIISVLNEENIDYLDFIEKYQKSIGLDRIIYFVPLWFLFPFTFLISLVPIKRSLIPISYDQLKMLVYASKRA